MTVEITGQEQVYKGWTTIRRLTLNDGTQSFTREVEDHGVAVAVLPYDPDRRTALLVRMPRAPVLLAHEADLLEAPAGLIDAGETDEAAIRREAAEEVGVTLGTLERVGTFWTCPGLSTERISLFLASYDTSHRIGAGGGLAEEHENITVIEMPLVALSDLLTGERPADMKTLALLQALRLRRPELF